MNELSLKQELPAVETVTDLLRFRQDSEHTALICGEESLSFEQLSADAAQIARCLIEDGLKKGDRVLLSVKNSIHVVRAIYGILLAGGVYVAADVKWPKERLRLVSEEAGVSVRITDEMISEFLLKEPKKIQLPAVRENDEAAVYYTSGSTGTPKGTVLCHRILLAYANPDEILSEFAAVDRFLTFPVFTSVISAILCFMLTAYEKTLIFTTPQEMTSIDGMTECMIRNRVQSMVGTPSFLLRAMENPLFTKVIKQQVKHLGLGGELLKGPDAKRLYSAMENGALSNGYGSSETYICSMSLYEPDKEVRLERMPRGVELHVVDEDLNPVSAGEEGELLIGGVSAQYGHYLDPELDRKKYVDHPVYGRCFRIGDAARLDADGNIILSGRIDRMIKLHGLRIEPGEVEAAMDGYDGILRSVVVLKNDQLCGYYTAEREINESGLREFLSKRLPYYMIPSIFIRMETFPESGNKKLDYNALPDPDKITHQKSAPENEPEKAALISIAPESDLEKLLCRIFEQVLNTPAGAGDSFFSLGGDSIHALMVMSLLEKEGFALELTDIFTAPTPRLLAPRLRVCENNTAENTEDTIGEDTVYPVTRHVKSRFKRRGSFYPVMLIGEIDPSITQEQLRERLIELSKKHDALRSRIDREKNEELVQVVQKQSMTEFFHVDLRRLSKDGDLSDEQKNYFSSLMRIELSERSESLSQAALRLGHIRISEEKTILTLTFSHYLLDGIGIAVILRELLGREPVLSDRASWKERIRRLSGKDRDPAINYWKDFFDQAKETMPFPAGKQTMPFPAGSDHLRRKKSFFMSGGRKLYEALKKTCKERGSTLSILMTYAIGRALIKVQGTKSALFYTMGTGRNAAEMNLPGMFTVSFPVYLKEEDTLEDLQRQLIRSEKHSWVFALPDAPLPYGEESLNLNIQNVPLPVGFKAILPAELDQSAADPAHSLLERIFAAADTDLEIQAYPDERFGFMGWCDTGRFDAAALETLLREALKELKQYQ